MKKISILIALILCATIGGVYATWNYAQTDDITDRNYEVVATIADAVQNGTNGTYTVTSNAKLVIDDANNDKVAELDFVSTSTTNPDEDVFLKVVFKPSESAPPAIKEEAVPTEMYFSFTSEMKAPVLADGTYNATSGTPKDIFVLSNESDDELNNLITWTKNDDGTFEYVIYEEDLKEAIKLNGTFILPTKADHDAFSKCLSGNIKVNFTDGTVN
jgi:hypothetical protein